VSNRRCADRDASDCDKSSFKVTVFPTTGEAPVVKVGTFHFTGKMTASETASGPLFAKQEVRSGSIAGCQPRRNPTSATNSVTASAPSPMPEN